MSKADTDTMTARLRFVADLLDEHPALPLPSVGTYGVYWNIYSWDVDDVPTAVAAIRRALGGTWDKRTDDLAGQMEFTRDEFKISVQREAVCVRRVVGEETVTLPAVEARPERTETREIVEWDCEPVLAKASS